MTKEVLAEVKRGCDFLIKNYEHFEENREDMEFLNNPDDYDDLDELPFFFPCEEEEVGIKIDKFIRLIDEFPTISVENDGRIKTKSMTYQIIGFGDLDDENMISYHDFALTLENGVKIDLVDKPFIVGLVATSIGAYNDDFFVGAISPYTAVEIDYGDENKVLSEVEEENLIQAYLFEIADSSGIALTYSEISDFDYDYGRWVKEMEEKAVENLRQIQPYNEGMQLFVSAIQINEPELKFLNFYKILEHFAPIIVNIEGNELMMKKLDIAHSKVRDGDFIRSIFDLVKANDEKYKDEDLIKSTFNISFDFVDLFKYLPESIQKKVKKQTGVEELTYKTNSNKISIASNMVGGIVYATRNKVVHAKSNFKSSGNECPTKDLGKLNEFLKLAASQSIRWYNRLPQHQKRKE